LDRSDRADHPRVRRGQEPDKWDHQQARVEPLRAVEARERVELGVEAAPADLLVDRRAGVAPTVGGAVAAEALDGLDAAAERDPRHHLPGRGVTAGPA